MTLHQDWGDDGTAAYTAPDDTTAPPALPASIQRLISKDMTPEAIPAPAMDLGKEFKPSNRFDLFDRNLLELLDHVRGDEKMLKRLLMVLEAQGITSPTKRFAPMPTTFTALQIGIWDNWRDGKEPARKKARYVADIGVWTGKPGKVNFREVADWTGKAALMTGAELVEQVERLMRPSECLDPLSMESLMGAREFADTAGDGWLGGILFTKKTGTTYFDRQFFLIDTNAVAERNTATMGYLMLGDTTLPLTAWDTRDAAGIALDTRKRSASGGRVELQCRFAPDDRFEKWRTQGGNL